MFSFVSKPVAFVLALVAVANAASCPSDPVCTLGKKGDLRTTTGQNIVYNADAVGRLQYTGHTGFTVQFRSCKPNWSGFNGTNGTPLGGQVYIPTWDLCLQVPTPVILGSTANTPFIMEAAPCFSGNLVTSSQSQYQNFVLLPDGKLYWSGITTSNGNYVTVGALCKSGFFGVPSTTTSGDVKFTCVNKAHTVGLTIHYYPTQ